MQVPFLDFSRHNQPLKAEIFAALNSTFDGNRFALGRDVEQFEASLAALSGTPGAVGCNNGTSALHLATAALGLGPGDEVIVPPYTFIASAWCVSYVGATLRFADIDPATFNLDPARVAAAITARTKAIVVVHLFGLPAPMDELLALAARHGLRVIEDCAQAIGAHYRGRPVGSLGDLGTYSFYPTKNLGACGEGGAVVSRHGDLLARCRLLRAHGMTSRYHHDFIGFNYRMEGMTGAVLQAKLPHLSRWTERRRAIARRYLAEIRLAETRLPSCPDYGESVYHQFTLLHPHRDALRAHLSSCGVGTDIIYPEPLHLQPCYQSLGYRPGDMPVAEASCRTCLSLPIFPELTDAEVGHVIASVNGFPG